MSNILNLPPNHHDGIYKGFLHTEGGIQSVLENGKKLEIEKDEFHLCSAVLQSEKIYEFKNATNKEILTKLFQDSSCIFEQGKSEFNDFIICRLVVLDKKTRNLTGNAKEIINILQSEKSCNVTEDAKEEFKKESGGKVEAKSIDKVTIKYKGFIPYVAHSYSHKFDQKATLLVDYSDDTIIKEDGKTDFKEPKYYSYGYLKTGTSLGTKRGWVLNLPNKGTSIEMEYHSQEFESVKDLYWVFEGRVFAFPEDATIEVKKITEKNQLFRDEYNLGNSLWSYGKKSYIAFNDSDVASVETYYDSTIEKSNKYYVVYFGDENHSLYEKSMITHSLPNAYLYARQFDVNQAYLITIENGKVVSSDDIYPYSDSTNLQEIAKDWLNEYYGLGEYDKKELEKGIKVEEEHRDTVEKLAKGEITAEEGVKEIASSHLAEDPVYYEKLEIVENPFSKFIEVVKESKDFNDAFNKVKKIKDVPAFVSEEFSKKYNPEGKLSMEQSFKVFYDEHKSDNSENEKELAKLLDKKDKLEERLYEAKLASNKVFENMGWGSGMRKSKISISTTKEDEITNKIKVIDKRIKELKGLNDKEPTSDEINLIIRDLSTMDSGLKDYDNSVYKSGYEKLLSSNENSVLSEMRNYIQFQKDNAKYFTNKESKANADKWLESLVKLESKLKKDFSKSEGANEVVNEGANSEKQELIDLIELLKEAVKENPNDEESRDALELYEETLKSIEGNYKRGGSVKRNLTYLGEVGGDKIGQKSSLERAKKLDEQDISGEQIREETGWFTNPYDKKWRFEISDEGFDVIQNFSEIKKMFDNDKNLTFVKKNLNEVIKHDKLFEAYPEFKTVPFYFLNQDSPTFVGVYTSKKDKLQIKYNLYDERNRISKSGGVESIRLFTNQKSALRIFDIINGLSGTRITKDSDRLGDEIYKFRRNILIHELQHVVQVREEFGSGSSPIWWHEELLKRSSINGRPIESYTDSDLRLEAEYFYQNSAGEIESKDVDLRLDFSEDKRKDVMPLSLIKVDSNYVTVHIEDSTFKNGGSINRDLVSLKEQDEFDPLDKSQIKKVCSSYSISQMLSQEQSNKAEYDLIMMFINSGEISLMNNYKSLSDLEKSFVLEIAINGGTTNFLKNRTLTNEQLQIFNTIISNRNQEKQYKKTSVEIEPMGLSLEESKFEKGGELTAEEAILNSPCINEKFKIGLEFKAGGEIKNMTKEELAKFYDTKEGRELDKQTYNKWKSLVNMSKSELENFYNSEEGKEAGLSPSEAKEKGIDSGRESARWIMKMKDVPYTQWTPDMWRWAKKQISFISRMSGMKGDLYDDKGNETRKHTSLLIWGHNPEKYENGGSVSFDKVISASSRFRPSETVVFDPPLEGKNGAKLISYTWSYEWTMKPSNEGELVSKRVSDWTQAEISADTGRDIVHQYTILMPNGEHKTVSSDSVSVLLGYLDKKELKSFPNLVTASKTLAKQQMQLAILEAQKKEYDELYAKFEKAEKPEIKEIGEDGKFQAIIESYKKGAYSNYSMGDITHRQDNDYIYETQEYKKRPITRDTIEQLTWQWISERVKENGGVNPRGLYDLKNRVARQKRKVENILNTKMENGGEVEDFDFSSLFNEESSEEKESRKKQEKISEEQEKEAWYQKSRFSKTWASTLKEATDKTVKSYFDAKATYDDWSSRQYKSNKGTVYSGGDDIHGVVYTIGGINENRRQNTLRGAKMQMEESIEDLKSLGLTQDEIDHLLFDKSGTLFAHGGKIEVSKVSFLQTDFSGLSFSDLGGYFDSNKTDVIDLEHTVPNIQSEPIFLFFKNPYDVRYSEKISIDDVIGAILPKKMEKDARLIFDKRYISYVTYSDDANNENKIEAIKKLADINEDIILK